MYAVSLEDTSEIMREKHCAKDQVSSLNIKPVVSIQTPFQSAWNSMNGALKEMGEVIKGR